MELKDFLLSLQGGAIELAVGVILSFVAEHVPAYEKLSKKQKRLVMGVVCLGLPLFASLASAFMGYQPLNFEATFWPALYAGGAVYLGSQGAHLRELKPKDGDNGGD